MANYFATTGVDNIVGSGDADFIYIAPNQLQAGDHFGGDYDFDTIVLAAPGAGSYSWDFTTVTFAEVEAVQFSAVGAGTLSAYINANQVEDGNFADPITLIGSSATDVVFVTLTSARTYLASPVMFSNWTDGMDLVTFVGSSGDDVIGGTSMSDVLNGNGGADTLTGGSGADTLDGGAGDDSMAGGAGDDVYYVDSGSDVISESSGEGVDTVQSAVTYTLGANLENLTLTGSGTINGTGNSANNVITGNSGANTLDGSTGADTLIGGDGNDAYVVDNAGDVVTESSGQGVDTVGASVSYTLTANVENLVLLASGLTGTGNGDANSILGSSGADTLDGGAGADTLAGGDGDDTYIVDEAGDTITENSGEGADLVQSSVTHTLAANVENLTLTGSDAIDGAGNGDANVITGNSGANVLDGLGGADTLIGGDGDDTYIVDDAGDTITESASEGADGVQSSVSYTLAANVENLTLTGSGAINGTGNGDANIITGNSAANTLDGSAGADTLIGGDGDDAYVVDDAGDVVTENSGEGADTVGATVSYTLSANVENLVLLASGLTGTGNSDANSILGSSGSDTLDGGAGADTLAGGDGDDTYVVDDAGDVITENASEGADTVQASVSYTLAANVENLTLTGSGAIDGAGNSDANVITGNSAANAIDGDIGADTMIGGDGDDTYYVDDAGDVITESADEGADLVHASLSYALAANVENLILEGSSDISGTGNGDANSITGNLGANTLDGGAGADTLIGGLGNDTYVVDDAGDVVTENASEGADTIQSSVSYTIAANVETLTLTGTADIDATGDSDNNRLNGNSGANTISGLDGNDIIIANGGDDSLSGGAGADKLNGGDGNDTMDGGAGVDSMFGGLGDDTYYVDDSGDIASEAGGGGGVDTIISSVSRTLVADIENLTLTGGAIIGTGNADANVITGNANANVLNGMAGDDTMAGGAGDDIYYVDSASDVVTEVSGEGVDTVFASASFTLGDNVDNLSLVAGAGALDGTGNADANLISGNESANTLSGMDGADVLKGNDGADSLLGGAGTDNLQGGDGNDTLDGGAGNDTLYGGAGDDTFVVDSVGDIIVENSGEGVDTIVSSINKVLIANVENLTLTGAAIIGAGNSDANVITGNANNNSLNGMAGADTMVGGDGNDSYYVDNSNDVVTENDGEGLDAVYATASFTLGANVENLGLMAGAGAIDGTGSADANTISGNESENTLSGMDGNDILKGNGGADSILGGNGADNLQGGDGNDTLDGGAGNDTLYGGAGDDTYYADVAGDIMIEASNGGTDTVISSIDKTLVADIENLTLAGAATRGYGNTLDNVLTGNASNNMLNGLSGADTMIGGAGDDVYYVDNAGDVVTEASGEGADFIYAAASYTMSANVENLGIVAGSGAVDIVANDEANLVTGNESANVISGMDGNDLLRGMAGADSLLGGNGADNLQGGEGNDTLDGGAGADTLYGGAGDDTYYLDASDVASEAGGGGVDTIYSATTRGLTADFENLVLTGSAAANGFGNALDNVLTGNSGANILQGQDGADRIDGGAGIDALYGGAGADAFVFTTFGAADYDTVVDFVAGTDHLELDSSVFTALGAPGALDPTQFHVGTAAADANDHLIYDSGTGRLYYDADGLGGAAQDLVAIFSGHPALSDTSILVI